MLLISNWAQILGLRPRSGPHCAQDELKWGQGTCFFLLTHVAPPLARELVWEPQWLQWLCTLHCDPIDRILVWLT